MNVPVRLLRLGRLPWRTTQAVYHAVAECMVDEETDALIFAVPTEPYFCVGFHQNPADILDVDYCRHRGLGVLRRRVGGGAVYLDSDQLFFQCVFHRSSAPARVDRLFKKFLEPAVAALDALGFPAELQGVNEITLGGRRISGTGAGQIGEASVVVGNVLVDFPYDEMIRAWRLPSDTFRRLAAEGLREHVTTLRRETTSTPSMEKLEKRFAEAYEVRLGRPLLEGRLTAREEDAIARLERELTAPDWLADCPPCGEGGRLKIARGVYVYETTFETGGGRVTLTVRLGKGRIEALEVRREGAKPVVESWIGPSNGERPDRPEGVVSALRRFGGEKGMASAIAELAKAAREAE